VDLLHGWSTISIFTILDQPSLPSCFIHIEQIDIPHNIVIAKTNILNGSGDFFGAFKSSVLCNQIPSSTKEISRCTIHMPFRARFVIFLTRCCNGTNLTAERAERRYYEHEYFLGRIVIS
jgi:hypothetical protein